MKFYEVLQHLLGLHEQPKDLTLLNVCCRGAIIFIFAIVLVRVSEKRFLPHKTAFDAILFFMLASMLSRAINGSGPFFQTMGATILLVMLHRLLAVIACRWHGFGKLIKGTEDLLVKDGVVMEEKLRRNNITMDDLLEELRLNGNTNTPEKIKEAKYERSGEISVVKS